MSFQIKLYKNLSELNRVDKNLIALTTVEGVLRDGTSILRPTILVQGDVSDVATCNYIEIPAFSRKYFASVEVVKSNLFAIICRVDVLSSFAEEIKTNVAIIKRQEKKFNLLLNDGSFRTYQNPIITTHPFPNGFSGQEFVLAVAGAPGV